MPVLPKHTVTFILAPGDHAGPGRTGVWPRGCSPYSRGTSTTSGPGDPGRLSPAPPLDLGLAAAPLRRGKRPPGGGSRGGGGRGKGYHPGGWGPGCVGTAAGLLLRLLLSLGPGRVCSSARAKVKLPARPGLALALAAADRPQARGWSGRRRRAGPELGGNFCAGRNSSAARGALGSRGPRAAWARLLKGPRRSLAPPLTWRRAAGAVRGGNWSPGVSSPHSISPWLCPSRTHTHPEPWGIVTGPESYPPGD